VLAILGGQELPTGLNDTFISLLPKVSNPQKVAQFRLIGLYNVVYKVVTKCIVHRLKSAVPNLISLLQSSFVSGRQIGDNVLIMQEIMHSMRGKKGSKGCMAIKIDLEKGV